MAQKYYPIISLSKEDLEEEFDGDEEALKKIKALTPQNMEYLASKLADDYCEQLYWSSLRYIFESRFLEVKP